MKNIIILIGLMVSFVICIDKLGDAIHENRETMQQILEIVAFALSILIIIFAMVIVLNSIAGGFVL